MVDGVECANATVFSDSEMRCDFPPESGSSPHLLYVSINSESTDYDFRYGILKLLSLLKYVDDSSSQLKPGIIVGCILILLAIVLCVVMIVVFVMK